MLSKRKPLLRCDGRSLKRLTRAALLWFEQHYETINQLNVFPVPDGDTGTNMLLTIRAAYRQIARENTREAGSIVARLAYGALHGSRGNSGTVLSQFMRGLAEALENSATFDATQLAAALRTAVQAGYRTFQKPVEGTILTVAREIAEEVETAARSVNDMRVLLARAVLRGRQAVARTPEMLPILKRAGVVDSGGQGLVVMLEGMLRYLSGQRFGWRRRARRKRALAGETPAQPAPIGVEALDAAYVLSEEYSAEGFGFDVQYMIEAPADQRLDVEAIRAAIQEMGQSAIVIGDIGTVKVHVHVHDPAVPLDYGRRQGKVSDVVVEDLQAQADDYRALRTGRAGPAPSEVSTPAAGAELLADSAPPALDYGVLGVVSVAPGDGLQTVFREQGAGAVVAGGQTMNPSVGELLAAIRSLNAGCVIVLPNNANVILTAQQAALLAAEQEGRQVTVIPTRTIPQGVAAMLQFNPEGDYGAVAAHMRTAASGIRTGEITRATRSLKLESLHVRSGQWIGLIDDELLVAGDEQEAVLSLLLDRMEAHDSEVITVYYGSAISDQAAQDIVGRLRKQYPAQVIEAVPGGQPHYPFILGVE